MSTLKLFVKGAIAIVFAFVLSLNLAVNKAMALGDFSQSCYDISVSGGTLSATCTKADGQTSNTSSINLDSYIGNVNGTLSWGYSNFSLTCEEIGISIYLLSANCVTLAPNLVFSTVINLDDHIANVDGTLSYLIPCLSWLQLTSIILLTLMELSATNNFVSF